MIWPFENNTDFILKKLVRRSLQSERRRNRMVIVAVLLAAFLISFAGAMTVSLLEIQNNQVKDTYEAVYSNISQEEVQKLKALPEVARAGEYYLLGTEESEQGYTGTFLYADKAMMYIGRGQMVLKTGHMPEKEDEIAVSEAWVEAFAKGTQTGDEITLDADRFQGTYRVSGIMDTGDMGELKNYSFFVSKEMLKQWPDYDASGYRAYIHLNTDLEMSEKEIKDYCIEAASQLQISSPSFHSQYFRWTFGGMDTGSLLAISLLAGLVLVGGSVVIQSIFRISVTEKIQYYGQLRTVGATRKQINRMVKKEGQRLGLWGILGGIFLGMPLSFVFLPGGFHLPGYLAAAAVTVLVCWGMIHVSLRKPVKIAGGVSPVEAIRFMGEESKITGRQRTAKKLAAFSLGVINFRRDRKKVISILASLSLGGILLLVVSSLLFTYSPERMARHDFPDGDYKLYIHSDRELKDILSLENPLNQRLKNEILSIDGVKEVMTERVAVYGEFKKGDFSGAGMCDMITAENSLALQETLIKGDMPADDRGILLKDNYLDNDKRELDVGTVIQMTIGEKTIPLTVSGFIDANKCEPGVGHGGLQLDGAMMFLPEESFHTFMPGIENFDYSWVIVTDSGKGENPEAELQNLIAGYADIEMETLADAVSYYRGAYSTLFHVLQGLALMISLFGVINLINTTLSNQISRRYETAVLRSVGLTKKQLYQMQTFEGLCYVSFSILLTLLVGIPTAVVIHRQLSMLVYTSYVPYTFPFLYMGLYGAALFILEFILSVWSIRRQRKYSLVEQLTGIYAGDS